MHAPFKGDLRWRIAEGEPPMTVTTSKQRLGVYPTNAFNTTKREKLMMFTIRHQSHYKYINHIHDEFEEATSDCPRASAHPDLREAPSPVSMQESPSLGPLFLSSLLIARKSKSSYMCLFFAINLSWAVDASRARIAARNAWNQIIANDITMNMPNRALPGLPTTGWFCISYLGLLR